MNSVLKYISKIDLEDFGAPFVYDPALFSCIEHQNENHILKSQSILFIFEAISNLNIDSVKRFTRPGDFPAFYDYISDQNLFK